MRLLSIHAATDRPAVVGSTGHLLGEAMDVREATWDDGTLDITLARGRAHAGVLLVTIPADWRHVATALDPPGMRLESGILRVPFDLRVVEQVRLQFARRTAA